MSWTFFGGPSLGSVTVLRALGLCREQPAVVIKSATTAVDRMRLVVGVFNGFVVVSFSMGVINYLILGLRVSLN